MKKTNVTILAVFCFICAIALSIFATNVKATTMEFGLQEYRKAKEDGVQYAYKIADKNVWKVVTYNGQTIDYDKLMYSLKAEQGLDTTNPVGYRQEYDMSYNFKDRAIMPTLPVAEEDYNVIIWILNHTYVQADSTIQNYKENLLKNAGITENIELTDDDIDVIQQLAIWYFTNKDNTTYHNEINGEPSLQNVLEAKMNPSGVIEDYRKIEEENKTRFEQMEKLFKYFVNGAKLATEDMNKIQVPISLDKTTPIVEMIDNNYIIGPYKINKDTDIPYSLNIKITDKNGKNLTGNYTLLDENKTEILDKTITDLLGQTFYIKIPVQTITENSIDEIKFSINGNYLTTNATYWTSSINSNVQPIIEIEKIPQVFTYENQVLLEVKKS